MSLLATPAKAMFFTKHEAIRKPSSARWYPLPLGDDHILKPYVLQKLHVSLHSDSSSFSTFK